MQPERRLYFEDPTCLEFDATIVERRALATGVGLVLDRSAFYPTSGGQPHDVGDLDGEPVLDVFEADDGAVVHQVARAPEGSRVHGRVDAARRHDHMQQHSGQHLLSATVLALYGRDTRAFHLGRERCTIDLDGDALDPAQVAVLEQRTNAIVWEARPVTARFVVPGEDPKLRKAPPTGDLPLRVVEIEGWDRNACCGTHVRSTSEIGLVKLLGQEKVGSATRLHFVCGARALTAVTSAHEILDRLTRARSCGAAVLVENVEQLAQDARALHKENRLLRERVAGFEAAAWIESAPRTAAVAVVRHVAQDATAETLRAWADAIVARGAVALVGARAPRPALLFAAPDGIELDLRPALAAATPAIDGKGGGPPGRVQAAGNRSDGLDDALALAYAAVVAALASRRDP